jgi:hypothetical protein
MTALCSGVVTLLIDEKVTINASKHLRCDNAHLKYYKV